MKNLTPYILIAPFAVLIVIFIIGIINALLQSFGYIPALELTNFTFDYYRDIFANETFMSSLQYSLYISIMSSIIATVLGVLICAVLVYTENTKGISFQIVRLPILIPHTIVALMVLSVFSQSGMLARLLYNLGIIASQDGFPNIIHNGSGVGILIAYVWKEAPFVAYFVLALMQSINKSLGEAAATLGASPVRAFFTITLPLSMPAIASAFLIVFAFSFGAYELPYLLGTTLPKALPVQAYIEYIHPDMKHRPYAMAMNGIIIMLTTTMAFIYFALLQRKTKELEGDIHGQ